MTSSRYRERFPTQVKTSPRGADMVFFVPFLLPEELY
jgi:hypothetical protein